MVENFNDHPIWKIIHSYDVKDKKQSQLAFWVYMDLCEVKGWWNMKTHCNMDMGYVYLSGHATPATPREIILPISTDTDLSPAIIQQYFQQFEVDGKHLQELVLGICSTDSCTVFYRVTNGLVLPESPEMSELKRYRREEKPKLDRDHMCKQRDLYVQNLDKKQRQFPDQASKVGDAQTCTRYKTCYKKVSAGQSCSRSWWRKRCSTIYKQITARCSDCCTGYEGSSCTDKNECSSSKDNRCSQNCINTIGSYRCSCNLGYRLSPDGYSCIDIIECVETKHGCGQLCVNTPGSYKCDCRTGYQLDSNGKTCSDKDECALKMTHECNHVCTNTVGSYQCSCLSNSFSLMSDGKTCQGQFNTRKCSVSQLQTVKYYVSCGWFGWRRCARYKKQTVYRYQICKECKPGFQGANCSTALCFDSTSCPNGGTCIGPDECSCPAGYAKPRCESVCKDHDCSHKCTANGNLYVCSCNSGYILGSDGRTCNALDPCQTNSHGCKHICRYDSPGRYTCLCRSGFTLQYDRRTCTDNNECLKNPCDHTCTNTEGSFTCACRPGFTASQSGATCFANNLADQRSFFLFTDTYHKRIYRMEFANKSLSYYAFVGISNPIAIDHDPKTGLVFVTDVAAKRIYSGVIDGSNQRTVRRLPFYSIPDGLTLDTTRRLVIYTDTGLNVIARMDYSGQNFQNIITTGLTEPRAIVLDTALQRIYWTDWGASPKIERSNYDGSSRQTLVSTGLIWPNGLVLVKKESRIYWTDAGTKKIEYINLDGTGRTVLYTTSYGHFFDIVSLGNWLYYSDWKRDFILSITKDGRNPVGVGWSGFGRINGLYLYDDGTHDGPAPVNPDPKVCQEGEMCADFGTEGSIQASLEGVTVMSPMSGIKVANYSRQAVFKIQFNKLDTDANSPLCHDGAYNHRQMLKVDLFLATGQGSRSGFSFNLGDSKSNNGYAGDSGHSDFAAEIQGKGDDVTVYASCYNDRISNDCKAQKLWNEPIIGPNVGHVTVYVANNYFGIVTDDGYEDAMCNKCLYGLDGRKDYRANTDTADTNVYLAVNRVVDGSYRSGYGTWFMKMSWVETGPAIYDSDSPSSDSDYSSSDSYSSGSYGSDYSGSGSSSSGSYGSDYSGSGSDYSGSGSDYSWSSGSDYSGSSSYSSGSYGSDYSGSGSDYSGSGSYSSGSYGSDYSGSGSDYSGSSSYSSGSYGSDYSGSGSDYSGSSSYSSGSYGSDYSGSGSDYGGSGSYSSGSYGSDYSGSGSDYSGSGSDYSGSGSYSSGSYGSDYSGSGSDYSGSSSYSSGSYGSDYSGSGSDYSGSGSYSSGSYGSDYSGSGSDYSGSSSFSSGSYGSDYSGSGSDYSGSSSYSNGSYGSDYSGSGSDYSGSGSDYSGSGSDYSGSGSYSSGSSGSDYSGSGSDYSGSGSYSSGSGSYSSGSSGSDYSSSVSGSGSDPDDDTSDSTSTSNSDSSSGSDDGSGSGADDDGDDDDGESGSGSGSGSYFGCNGLSTCSETLVGSKLAVPGSNCENYCQCMETNENGTKKYVWNEYHCGPGHIWDAETRFCDLRDNSNYICPNGSYSGPEALRPKCNGTCAGPSDEDKLSARNNTECVQFCQCVQSDDSTYTWQTFYCQHGSLWASKQKKCVAAYKMTCLANGTDVYDSNADSEDPTVDDEVSRCPVELCGATQAQDLVMVPYSNCSKFCQCAPAETLSDGTTIHKWVVKICAPGSHWSHKVRSCGSFDHKECEVPYSGDDDDDTITVDINVEVQGPRKLNCSGVCSDEFHGTMTSELKSNCTQYCHCVPKTNAESSWIRMFCPPGTLFESNKLQCLHEYEVQCQDNGFGVYTGEEEDDSTTSNEQCPNVKCDSLTSGNTFVIKETNCTQYCKCSPYTTDAQKNPLYKWVTLTCPEGEALNATSGKCETYKTNICPEESTGGSSAQCEGTCYQSQWQQYNVSTDPDCRSFCQCCPLNNDPAFYWQIMHCGANTRFSLNYTTCVHENNANCSGKNNTLPEGTCPVNECKTVQNQNLMLLPGSNCKKFCQCSPLKIDANGTAEYTWVVKNCAYGTRWNNRTGNCGHFDEDSYVCPDSGSSSGSSGGINNGCPDTCDQNKHGNFTAAVDSTCLSYCQCAPAHNGGYTWLKMYCALGTLFDKSKKQCLLASEVKCTSDP